MFEKRTKSQIPSTADATAIVSDVFLGLGDLMEGPLILVST